jgi:uncharacterized protein YukE
VSIIKYDPAAMQTAITDVQRTHAQLLAKGAEFRSLWNQIGPAFDGPTAASAAAVNHALHTASVNHHNAVGNLGRLIDVANQNLGRADARNAASWTGGARH